MNAESLSHFNEKEIDVLREIASIGAGHAATALSELLASRVSMDVPLLRFLATEELINLFDDPQREVVGTVFQLTGDIKGNILYIIDQNLCCSLLQIVLDKTMCKLNDIDLMDQSALTEISNIVVSSYINAIAETIRLQIRISPPNLALDMIGAILNYPLQINGDLGNRTLFIEDVFANEDEKVTCNLFIMLEPESLALMMHQMGIKHG